MVGVARIELATPAMSTQRLAKKSADSMPLPNLETRTAREQCADFGAKLPEIYRRQFERTRNCWNVRFRPNAAITAALK